MQSSRKLLVTFAILGSACTSGRDAASVTGASDVRAVRSTQSAQAPKDDPACRTAALKDSEKGKIKKNSCEFTPAGKGQREDLYTRAGDGPSQMTTFTASAEFSGLFGATEANQPLFTGIVFGYEQFTAGTPIAFSIVGSSSEYGFFLGGADSTQLGKYEVTTTTGPVVHSCDRGTFLEGTISFHTTLDGSNSCEVIIRYSPYPAAIGKPIWTHNWYAKVKGGHSYTVRMDGVTNEFSAGLTIFGGGVLAQDVGPSPSGVRQVTFTPATTRYILVEVSSGRFVDGNWVQQAGNYGLTFTSN